MSDTKPVLMRKICDLKTERDQLKASLNEWIGKWTKCMADRDRLRAALDRIATDYDCDPRAEARAALEGKS